MAAIPVPNVGDPTYQTWGKSVADRLNAPIGVSLVQNAVLPVPQAALTKVPWNFEAYDPYSFHDPASNPTRSTVPAGVGGMYSIRLLVQFAAATGGAQRYAEVYKNGGGVGPAIAVNLSAITVPAFLSLAADIRLVPGDYLEVAVYQDAPGTVNMNGGFFSVVKWAE